MKNLKTVLKTNNVEDYMSNVSIADFIKDYESLDEEELKKFISLNNQRILSDSVSFSNENIPPYID